ncbi:MAG: amidoligase family protein [Rhodobacteraceae bacterium]|nr:amidoligase family protein [Paracoccaceae bacterium]
MTQAPLPPLPRPLTAVGEPRRTGVEIELGGLAEEQVARLAATHLGGQARRATGEDWEVTGTRIGALKVYLDIFLRKHADGALKTLGLKIGREVIPVEIVTDPLNLEELRVLSQFIERLRKEGAEGTSASVLYGFGLHLNPEIAGTADADIVRPLLAFALIEEWMHETWPIERTRELLPFTAPYPRKLVAELVRLGPDAPLAEVIAAYRAQTLSRNHGLDMLPVFTHLRPDLIAPDEGTGGTIHPRPAFHFRLPDCRIDDPDWSLGAEWRRWWLVEAITERPELLETVRQGWTESKAGLHLLGDDWVARCDAILKRAGLV